MVTSSSPDDRPVSPDAGSQRRALLLLSVLADVIHVITLVYLWQQGSPRVTQAAASLAITAVLTALTLWSAVPLRRLQQVAVALVCVLLHVNLWSVFQTQRPISSGLLIHVVILALFAYTWLPPRVATAVVGGSYVILACAAAVSRAPDVPGVLLVGITLPLVWYLTVHGREVSRERGRSETMRILAYRDPLTGVQNRRAGSELLHTLLTRPAGHPGATPDAEVAVALIDLDHFKRINDTLGHQQGDRVLVAVADSLVLSFAPDGTVVRWGGEEFLVILTGQTRAAVRQHVDAALDAVRALHQGGLPVITISAGLAFSGETRDPVALLDLADGRLYRAKAAGRDRVH
ncbi:GGDEF domain-containing protein [Deinococcus rufus]|uniref:GGDEF domain-containing protein n=1 Tax=Deinococcus rufus TaxID=2136097 RepID=UPI0036D31802